MSAVKLEPFDELIDHLRKHGFSVAAESISRLRDSAWTTSSEMMGELGIAVLKIQSQIAAAPEEVTRAVGACLNEVRKVWPHIKLP